MKIRNAVVAGFFLLLESETANGFQMRLEGGKDYYFFQDIFTGRSDL
jgi:hypothetical protein